MSNEPKSLTLKAFLRIFKDNKDANSSSKYCFLLGAGASVSSGIPSGGQLAKKWYEIIKEDTDLKEFEKWKEDKKINEKELAASYSAIYEKRFRANPADGYAEIQNQLTGKEPNVGYAFFAKILAETEHRFVITTNFDSLIEDALFIYTKTKPLVCGHESLAGYINIHGNRPTIVKIHRDVLLNPISDKEGTNTLKEQWKEALKSLLSGFYLVVVGYGGNDGSLMDYLKELKDNRKPIYWCFRKEEDISEQTKEILKENDYLIKINGFDELMVELQYALGLKIEPEGIVKNAEERRIKFEKALKEFGESATKKGEDLSLAVTEVLWGDYQRRINQEKDIDKQDAIYREGIEKLPDAHQLIGNYALFLKNIRKEYDQAEIYYKKALELSPESANHNGNYAVFLKDIRKEYDQAEIYYKKALELEPNHAVLNGNYASFLKNIRREYEQAETCYKKALALDPDSANKNGNYGGFLLGMGRKEEANPYIEKAFQLISKVPKQDLELKLWFYKLAHYPEHYEEAKTNIDRLLSENVRSIGWDFSINIEQAEQERHLNLDELKGYANKITFE